MGRVCERTFSGYRLWLPKGLKVEVVDLATGKRYKFKRNEMSFLMRQRVSYLETLLDESLRA